METDRVAPAQAANETKPDASDRKASEAATGDVVTRTAARRGLNQRPMLSAGLLALMALSAGAYVYWVWDASHEIANRPKSEPPAAAPRLAENSARPLSLPGPAATPAPVEAPLAAAAPAPAATPAPLTPAPAAAPAPSAIAAAPKSAGPPTEAPVAPAEPAPPASLQQQPASLPKEDVVFVQKPGVRMRSEPGRHGKVIGKPAKGSQFKIVGRAGSWIQVEGDAGRGWIGGRMLGLQSP